MPKLVLGSQIFVKMG